MPGRSLVPGVRVGAACLPERRNQRFASAFSDNAFEIGDNDNCKTFCAPTGTGVYVFLHSGPNPGALWRSIHPSSGVLEGRASGLMSLARGVTGAYFGAARPGTVTLTSTRSPCAAAGSPCATRLLFKVTVVVR